MFDAHNHLHDSRLGSDREKTLRTAVDAGVQQMCVNGTAPQDWEAVARLARTHPAAIVPTFGLHPWFINDAEPGWEDILRRYLDEFPHAGLGEIGLDRWVEPRDEAAQEDVFRRQLRLALRYNRPVTVHCLKAWGWLLDILQEEKPLPHGFLLHSYNGPAEMLVDFDRLGALYSFSGYFAHDRKKGQREVFKQVALDRLLVETDAPDMLPPDDLRAVACEHEGQPVNHPANLPGILDFLCQLRDEDAETVRSATTENARRLFLPQDQ